MDVLIVEPFDPEVVRWLGARHAVCEAPGLASNPLALQELLPQARALVAPPSLRLDPPMLRRARMLRIVAHPGATAQELLDLDACERAGVEVVRGTVAQAPAQAEFVIAALLTMLRDAAPARELGGSTVGLFGMQPSARALVPMLDAFGARVVGYDPSLHASDVLWERWQVEPLALGEFFGTCDLVCVLLPMFSRYRGLIGERLLGASRPGQRIVSLTHASVFDEAALAAALNSGRVGGVWLDHADPALQQPGRALAGVAGVRLTPQRADRTVEAARRNAWHVAQRIDTVLSALPAPSPPGLTRYSRPPAEPVGED